MSHQHEHEQTMFRQLEAQFLLRGVSGITFAKSFPLLGSMMVGRTDECDITIPDDGISRNHARIIARPGSILVEDMGSANGTFVNGKPIEKMLVKEGDEIRFDKIRFQIQSLNQLDEFLNDPYKIHTSDDETRSADGKSGGFLTKFFLSIMFIGIVAGAYLYYAGKLPSF